MNELQSLIAVGHKLRSALQETIDSCPGLPRRPYEMARVLKVDKSMTSRLCSALRSDDSVAMLAMFPGEPALKQFLRAVGMSGGNDAKIDAAQATLTEFEALVKEEFDDRTGLNAVVGAIVPEMARRHELKAKQDAFRAFETFKGVSVDFYAATCFFHPNAQDSNWIDSLWLNSVYGVRRIRPGATIQQSISNAGFRDYAIHPLGIDKEVPVFREFCRPSNLEVVRQDLPDETAFHVPGSSFGRSSAVDIVIADYQLHAVPIEAKPGTIRSHHAYIDEPVKQFMMTLLIHESLWTDKTYQIRVYDAVARFGLKLTPSTVDDKQLYLNESVEFLGKGIERLRDTDIPRYFEMIQTVMHRMNWQPGAFRCFRCHIDYPVHGSHIHLVQTPFPPEA